jgi:hypothetical protein
MACLISSSDIFGQYLTVENEVLPSSYSICYLQLLSYCPLQNLRNSAENCLFKELMHSQLLENLVQKYYRDIPDEWVDYDQRDLMN